MQIVILGTEAQKEELMQGTAPPAAELIWVADIHEITMYDSADAIIDLLFENNPARVKTLGGYKDKLVIINSVTDTLPETNTAFIRIAGWNTFLTGTKVEGCCLHEAKKEKAEEVMAELGKSIEWLPDTAGFVTPRVVSTIINEAYLALEEGVSTQEEIDTAMKLGTAYPFGPVEWGNRIGLQNVVNLLHKLSVVQPRYKPADLLVQQTKKVI